MGTRAGPIARRMLRGRKTKHWMRLFYAVRSAMLLRRASLDPSTPQDYWQAGKSVRGIDQVRSVAEIMTEFADAARAV
jgi:nitronate monooxygenase